jgi:hypothetical protein
MADIKKGSDLITTMGATEKRMKKLERQLAVPRTTSSVITTAQGITTTSSTPTTAVALATTDILTVVTTTRCIIDFYLTYDYSWTWTGVASDFALAYIYLRDNETGYTYALGSGASLSGGLGYAASGVYINSTYSGTTFSPPKQVSVFPSPLWASASGAHKFELRVSMTAIPVGGSRVSTTFTLKNRAFYARVTPF